MVEKELLVIVLAVPASLLVLLAAILCLRYCCRRSRKKELRPGPPISVTRDVIDSERGIKPSFFFNTYQPPVKPRFSWYDSPRMIMEAVEHGWSSFAFAPSPSFTRSISTSVAGKWRSASGHSPEGDAEMSWEVPSGSSEAMQKISFRMGADSSAVVCTVAALPLPGPPLGISAFPQEAYFELIFVRRRPDEEGGRPSAVEGEKTKLMNKSQSASTKSDSLVHVNSTSLSKIQASHDDPSSMICLGLTGPGAPPADMLPGCYPGSIGFFSNGAVYLHGTKLVMEWRAEEDWAHGGGEKEKVVGCGFDPKKKKVIFTVDGKLVHEIVCGSEDFAAPMYPAAAATEEAVALVNMGQAAFRYPAANAQRTANPCFVRAAAVEAEGGAPASGVGRADSREIFPTGRVDSRWRAARKVGAGAYADDGLTVDSGELFEIALAGPH